MVHDLNPKNPHIDGLLFLQNPKNPIFRVQGIFGHYPQNEIFFQKSDSISFSSVRHPNFKKSFRKTLWAIYMFTYWHTDSGKIIVTLFT